MRTELVATLIFGAGSPLPPVCVTGWSGPENGYTWSIGNRSEVLLPAPPPAESYLLECSVQPMVRPGKWPKQDLIVEVGGEEVGRATLTRRALLGFVVPARLLEGGAKLAFVQPDAVRSCDIDEGNDARPLAMMTRTIRVFRILPGERSKLPVPEVADDAHLMGLCESIGDNCEFGLVQRKFGAEPVTLLRFSSIPIHLLVLGIDESFAHFTDPDAVAVEKLVETFDYNLYVKRYGFVHHSFIKKTAMAEAEFLKKQSVRLQFLARMFIEELELARRLFVVKRSPDLSFAEVLPLFAALNRHGPCSLLFVGQADADHSPATVRELIPGLQQGWLSGFSNRLAVPVHPDEWMALIRNAFVPHGLIPRAEMAAPVGAVQESAEGSKKASATEPALDRWGLPPPMAGVIRGRAANVRNSEQEGQFGKLLVVDFDLVVDSASPPVPVRMSGTDYLRRVVADRILDVPDPTPAVRPITPTKVTQPLDPTMDIEAINPFQQTPKLASRLAPAVLLVMVPVILVGALLVAGGKYFTWFSFR